MVILKMLKMGAMKDAGLGPPPQPPNTYKDALDLPL